MHKIFSIVKKMTHNLQDKKVLLELQAGRGTSSRWQEIKILSNPDPSLEEEHAAINISLTDRWGFIKENYILFFKDGTMVLNIEVNMASPTEERAYILKRKYPVGHERYILSNKFGDDVTQLNAIAAWLKNPKLKRLN